MSFWTLGRPFLDPGTTPGPVRAQDATSCEKITILLQFGCPRGPQIETILVILTTFSDLFFVVFSSAHFSHNLQFQGPFGIQFVMFFGVPGTLGNMFKTLKGIRFSHFGDLLCRYDFQARSGGCFSSLCGSLWEVFLGQKCEK